MKNKTFFYSLCVILAGITWGTLGVFARYLTGYGFSSVQGTTVRYGVGVCFLGLFMLIFDRSKFKISLKGFLMCAGIGIFSSFFMSVLYFVAIDMTSLSVAAILIYTAPVWVVLASVLLHGEKFSLRIGIALVIAFLGCVFVSGFSAEKISAVGILCGLGSGIAYALYSILGKYALKVCPPLTMTFYSLLVAAVAAILVCNIGEMATIVTQNVSVHLILTMLGTGFLAMFLPFLLYTVGLSGLPAGKASIMATVEPMMATVLGMVLFGEIPSLLGFLGIVLIILAIVILSVKED